MMPIWSGSNIKRGVGGVQRDLFMILSRRVTISAQPVLLPYFPHSQTYTAQAHSTNANTVEDEANISKSLHPAHYYLIPRNHLPYFSFISGPNIKEYGSLLKYKKKRLKQWHRDVDDVKLHFVWSCNFPTSCGPVHLSNSVCSFTVMSTNPEIYVPAGKHGLRFIVFC